MSGSDPLTGLEGLIAAGCRDEALALARQSPDPIEACRRILHAWPEDLPALDALAGLAFEARALPEAIAGWQRVLALAPSARTWNNLGSAQLAAGQQAEAQASFEQALALDDAIWTAHYQLAGLLLGRGRYQAALPHARAALPHMPKLAARLYPLALELARGGEQGLAAAYLALCCAYPNAVGAPGHEILASQAGCLLYADEQAARAAYAAAGEQAPAALGGGLAYAWSRLLALPYIYESHAQLQQSRANFGEELEQFAARIDRRLDKSVFLQLMGSLRPPFLLAYQGCDDRSLMERIGRIWTDFLVRHGASLDCGRGPRPQRRLRVGFASRFFYAHSVMLAFGETIAELAAEPDFEVICIQLDPHADAHSSALEARVGRLLRFEGPVSARALLELDLDVLIYPDIGMDHLSYQLALHRLAPIQCVMPGHPVTSGLPAIDYYLSLELCEPAGAQAHYSETLVPCPPGHYVFSPATSPARRLSRAELGLPADRHLYYCPMTLFKLHPDFDALVGGILAADPKALVLLPQYRKTGLHLRLQARLNRSLGPLAAGRIGFMPWLEREDLESAILLADAVLDSYSFSGGTTSQLVLALGQPCVTLPSPYLRGRITAGFYRRIGLPELIAASPQAYVEQAVRLASEPDYRRELQHELRARHSLLHSLPERRFSLADFLRKAAASWPDRVVLEREESRQ